MDFGTILHIVKVGVVMIVMISILVAAHEYGHYLFARLFGMGVEEFAIGFGRKPLWTWMRKTYEVEHTSGPAGAAAESYVYPTDGSGALAPEPAPTPSATKLTVKETTDFTVRPWPLGGFVRIKGMMPEDDGSETKVPGGFYSKAPWKRFLVLLAGPLFSVLAGVIILVGIYTTIGDYRPVNKPIIGSLVTGMAAHKAKLEPGDTILSLDGQPLNTFIDLTDYVRARPGKEIKVVYEREGVKRETVVKPDSGQVAIYGPDLGEPKQMVQGGKLGIRFDAARVKLPFGEALSTAIAVPKKVVEGLVGLIRKPSAFKDNVGGPGTIAKVTSDATKAGIEYVIELAAMLSISVGIFNLLPVPPLDGGQMVVAIAEMLRRGRRLSMKVQQTVAAVGFALVMMLVVSVIFVDIGRLSGGAKGDQQVLTKENK